MAQGRWLDDAYGNGAPNNTPAGPRLIRWMKWTWPLALVGAIVATRYIGSAGWAVAVGGWFATCVFPEWMDQRSRRLARRRA